MPTGCIWLRLPVCARCCLPGWCGTTGPGAYDGVGGLCLPGVGMSKIPAAEAPTTAAVAAATHAAGWVRNTFVVRPSHARSPTSSAIPAGASPARHPARREARIASATASRWRLASSASDT